MISGAAYPAGRTMFANTDTTTNTDRVLGECSVDRAHDDEDRDDSLRV
jgi:hypothetical protein